VYCQPFGAPFFLKTLAGSCLGFALAGASLAGSVFGASSLVSSAKDGERIAAKAKADAELFAGRRRLFAAEGDEPAAAAASEEESPRVGPSPPQLLPAVEGLLEPGELELDLRQVGRMSR
jgi:hypothetical protein